MTSLSLCRAVTCCNMLWPVVSGCDPNTTAGGRNWGSANTCVASFARSSPAGRDGSIFARTANLMQCALCQGPTSWAWWWCVYKTGNILIIAAMEVYIYICVKIYIYMKNIWYVYGQYVHICIDEDFDVHIFPQRGVAKMMWVVASWAPDGRNGIRGGKHLPIQPWQHFPPPLMRRGKKPIFCRRRGKNKGKKRKTRKSLKMRETRVDEIF